MKHIYTMGLKNQGISEKDILPHLRVGLRISQYRACNPEVFVSYGADLSLESEKTHRQSPHKGVLGYCKAGKNPWDSHPHEHSARHELSKVHSFPPQ